MSVVSMARLLAGAAIVLPKFCVAELCWRDIKCTGPAEPAFPGPWDSSNFAPATRFVQPQSIVDSNDLITSDFMGDILLTSDSSLITLDFGKEVGGTIGFSYNASTPAAIGIAFTEARNFIGRNSDFSNGGSGADGAIYANISILGTGTYAMPDAKLRGGFRYLTFFLDGDAAVHMSNITLEIGFQPTWPNLRAYSGYFHSSDEELNRIWYAGAYTLQTNIVPLTTGRQTPFPKTGWNNNALLGKSGSGASTIVDGAKRDRAVWPGDMGVAVPSTFVSIGDLIDVRTALQAMYDYQNSDGSFPEAGPPLLQQGSDTYHMWTMIGTYNYVLYTNDTAWLYQNWPSYVRAMDYVYGKVGNNGLLNVTGIRDWARLQQGFNNTAAQVILYHTLQTGASLAGWLSNPSLSSTYLDRASDLFTAINTHTFDNNATLFRDNATSTSLHPQDANSFAILFNATSPSRAHHISQLLTRNWTPIGPTSPELPNNISPFISSFELAAHFSIRETTRALDLLRRTWSWYLNHPNGTQSTLVEGYLTNGSWGYRYNRGYVNPSYTSHAHGWSTGPTSALTEYVLGLKVTDRAGSGWSFEPQFGDLEFAEGGFTTGLGKFWAKWKRDEDADGYRAEIHAPQDTIGQVVLPSVTEGVAPKVVVNGEEVRLGGEDRGDNIWTFDGSFVRAEVAGADWTIEIV